MLATYTVNTEIDKLDFTGDLSFREAIFLATSPGDIVDFDPNEVNGAIIELDESLGEIAILDVDESLTIDASMLTLGITIDAGNGTDQTPFTGDGIRIFNITDPTGGTNPPHVTMIGLTLTGADTSGNGGAIQSAGILTLQEMVIVENGANQGGGIYLAVAAGGSEDRDALTIENSTIQDNIALGAGGGLYVQLSSTTEAIQTARIVSSNITGNTASVGAGGGIYSRSYGSHLQIENSTISGNHADGLPNGKGGGVFAKLRQSASLSIVDSVISGNTAGADGGGVHARAYYDSFPTPRAITISRSLISGNTALHRGGGLYTWNDDGTETLIEDSRITGNMVPTNTIVFPYNYNGGGIYAYLHGFNNEAVKPRFIITGSTVDNNTTKDEGGGIFVCCKKFGHFIATNSTFSGNSTLDQSTAGGGGLVIARDPSFQDGSIDADLRNVTVTQNTSKTGGGILIKDLNNVRVRIANTIISENKNHSSQPNNLVGRVVDEVFKHNLVGSGSSIEDEDGDSPTLDGTNILNNNAPGLDALADNGGLTPTHALRFGSPAIDEGSNDLAKDPLTPFTPFATDQRGTSFARSYDFPGVAGSGVGPVDIGAYELTQLCVTTTTDEFNGVSVGGISLREAVNYANTAGVPMTICLPAGLYILTISGTSGVSQGDLDITGNVTIVGDGPGETIIDGGGTTNDRIFDVASGATLNVSLVTLTLGDTPNGTDGGAIRVQNGGIMNLDYSAIVSSTTGSGGDGAAIYFAATGSGSIRNSVITVNEADDIAGGVRLASASSMNSDHNVIVQNSIIAKNTDGGGSTPDVFAGINRSFTSEGNNRLGNATTGFTNGVNGDIVGTPDYIVTTLADTYDGLSDPVSMSLRDAIHQANITPGAQEIWLPAWNFVLTRERTAAPNSPELDISQGDLDITDSLVIRGIGTATSVEWSPGVMDRVFELVGDYNGDGEVDAADWTVWRDTKGSTPDPGAVTADGDDDGDIDDDDEDIWTAYYGNTFDLF